MPNSGASTCPDTKTNTGVEATIKIHCFSILIARQNRGAAEH